MWNNQKQPQNLFSFMSHLQTYYHFKLFLYSSIANNRNPNVYLCNFLWWYYIVVEINHFVLAAVNIVSVLRKYMYIA